jgi:hypothetical protein
MKYISKVIAITAILSLSFYGTTYSSGLGVDAITVVDSKTLNVTLSENPNLEVGEIEGEIIILNDMELRGGSRLAYDAFSVKLLLESPLSANTTYSLISITGADGTMDFTTGDAVV